MLIISDTNILSSFAAADSLFLLARLFPNNKIFIPPVVEAELVAGVAHGKSYLATVLQAIKFNEIEILTLSLPEKLLSQTLPNRLNPGECEAIALAQKRQGRLLSNDQRAVRYCNQQQIEVLDLTDLLRLLWLQRVLSPNEVKQLITRMEQVEKLSLTPQQRVIIFAPRRVK